MRRELDFFIKNEIMHLDDLDTENEQRFEQYLSKIKVIKNIGHKIIAFLEQIENFQKKLWLKKKFVVESEYCITLDKIPTKFYEEIAQNQAQIDEWKRLFKVNKIKNYTEQPSVEFLVDNQNLILDTKFFTTEFKDKILSHFEDIDSNVNGLIIQSDNYQMLNLLETKYHEKVDCIYIDPPYNAKSSEILYKNSYKHSSWLTMMENRIRMSKKLTKQSGLIEVAIDDYEWKGLAYLLDEIYGAKNFISNITVVHNPRGRNDDKFLGTSHEYMMVYGKDTDYAEIGLFDLDEEDKKQYSYEDEISKYGLQSFMRTGNNSNRHERPNLYYSIFYSPDSFELSLEKRHNSIELLPINSVGEEKVWRWSRETFLERCSTDIEVKYINGEYRLYRKRRMIGAGKKPKTVWHESKYDASSNGIMHLRKLLGRGNFFSYPKSIHLVYDALFISTNKESLVMDYFAGSGTTAEAVIKLNENDKGNRKYLLAEMGEYFHTVTIPRIQKVAYSKEWKDGAPVSREGISHMFQYMKLESYEDTLNNIELERTSQQQEAMEEAMSSDAKEEYLLSYMLDVESEGSSSLLNIDAFYNPFNYKMLIQDGIETKKTRIDIVETFNYLIGLYVKTIDTFQGIKVITGTLRTGEESLIIWRNTDEVSNEKLENFFEKQEYNTKDTEFDRIYVNGDNHLENMKTDVDQWKVVLIEEEFKRLMFDVHDV